MSQKGTRHLCPLASPVRPLLHHQQTLVPCVGPVRASQGGHPWPCAPPHTHPLSLLKEVSTHQGHPTRKQEPQGDWVTPITCSTKKPLCCLGPKGVPDTGSQVPQGQM